MIDLSQGFETMSSENLPLKPIQTDLHYRGSYAEPIPSADISADASAFAKKHGLWGSLVILKTMILSNTNLVSALKVELSSDPEVEGWFTICFRIQTHADVPEVLDFDDRLRLQIGEDLPSKDQVFFAVCFDFD